MSILKAAARLVGAGKASAVPNTTSAASLSAASARAAIAVGAEPQQTTAAAPAVRGRVVFVNRYFWPDHSATSQLLTDLAFALAADGLRVTVITGRQYYDDPEARLAGFERASGVDVHRVRTSRFGRGSLPGRSLDYLTFYVATAWLVWRLARPGDTVVVKTDPPLLSAVLAPLVRWRGARLVNWLQDLYPEVAEAAGIAGRLGRGVCRLLRLPRDRALKAAAANVVLGSRMAEHLTRLGVARSTVIANWQDGALVRPVPPEANALRRAWNLEGAFVVAYSGNLGRVHELDTVLDAIERLERDAREPGGAQLTPIVFLFLGGGALYGRLRGEAARRGLSSVRIMPYQPRGVLAESLSVADLHLVTLRPEFEGLIVPSKFYGVAAAGRPTVFVGDPDGEVARLVHRFDCGVVASPGRSEDLAHAIAALSRDPARCAVLGQNGRAMLEGHFDKRHAMAAWRNMLRVLAAERT